MQLSREHRMPDTTKDNSQSEANNKNKGSKGTSKGGGQGKP